MCAVEKSTKMRITQEAANLFYELGYKKATMRKIAQECDLTHAAIFKYFKNKNALSASLIYRYFYGVIEMTIKFLDRQAENEKNKMYGLYYFWTLHFTLMKQDHKFSDFYYEDYQNNDEGFVKTLAVYSARVFRGLFGISYRDEGLDYYIDMKMLSFLDITLVKLLSEDRISVFDACLKIQRFFCGISLLECTFDETEYRKFVDAHMQHAFEEVDIMRDFLSDPSKDDMDGLLDKFY